MQGPVKLVVMMVQVVDCGSDGGVSETSGIVVREVG